MGGEGGGGREAREPASKRAREVGRQDRVGGKVLVYSSNTYTP